jgi:hypothetical protein
VDSEEDIEPSVMTDLKKYCTNNHNFINTKAATPSFNLETKTQSV